MEASLAAPIAFTPLFKERVWGGRALEGTFGKPLPPEDRIGESWELVDRDDAQSVVASGPLAGTELQTLWTHHREAIFGSRAVDAGERFPLLVKLLDARETLSVQVHPPGEVADELGGEPKTEVWYVAATGEGAHLLAGLRPGVTEAAFAETLRAGGDVTPMLHRLDVSEGDALFIPSGRVHALGAGCLVVEIQENSDTTYRVYDFDRPGLDGEQRELHVPESLAAIDFADQAPTLRPAGLGVVAANSLFTVTRRDVEAAPETLATPGECAFVFVLEGSARCGDQSFGPGEFFLLPADAPLPVTGPAALLITELPDA